MNGAGGGGGEDSGGIVYLACLFLQANNISSRFILASYLLAILIGLFVHFRLNAVVNNY